MSLWISPEDWKLFHGCKSILVWSRSSVFVQKLNLTLQIKFWSWYLHCVWFERVREERFREERVRRETGNSSCLVCREIEWRDLKRVGPTHFLFLRWTGEKEGRDSLLHYISRTTLQFQHSGFFIKFFIQHELTLP
jgi:hypothetical protein